MGDDPRIPDWGEDGYITERIIDLLTFKELRQLVRQLPQSLPDAIKKEIKDLYQNLISTIPTTDHRNTIIETANRIITIIKEHLSQEAYLNELSRFRDLRLTVQHQGHSYPVVVRSSWQVSKLKILIEQYTEVDRQNQRLSHKGRELRNERTLEAERIPSEALLIMIDSSIFEIIVNGVTNTIIVSDLSPNSLVEYLLAEVRRRQGIRGGYLLFRGKQLEPSHTLASYGITSGSTIDFCQRCPGG